mmetsp:Transcript_48181/g.103290  ORF Transcript_48181/g.103290 Transcript_48181/m.103290 type:complete len:192 (-) Transcript_48181:35-610(-)
MGAGGSVRAPWSSSARPVRVPGKRILADAELNEMLKGWVKLGVQFNGVMLVAEGKEAENTYSMARDKWTTTETIVGSTGVVLKTTGDGWLHLSLSASGFQWQHIGSYRKLQLKVVDSSTKKFPVAELEALLEEQRECIYEEGTWSDFSSFSKRLFEGLSGKKCEGARPLDLLGADTGSKGSSNGAPVASKK